MTEPLTKGTVGPEAAFEPLALATLRLPNRLVRAATYEGLAERDGRQKPELGELYGAYLRGAESPLAELAVQYADWAAWQRDRSRANTALN